MKRLFAILTTLTLLLGMTACGQTGQQGNPSKSQQEETSSVGDSSSGDQSAPPASSAPEDSESEEEPAEGGVLVAYFSATGNTEGIALHLQNILDTDLYEIVPEVPYTDEDLNYSNDDCRANQEQKNPTGRPAITGTLENPEDYDVVFLGYPIWWGIAAWPVDGFVSANDFSGKTVIPFATSSSSGMGNSGELLEELAGTGEWLDGQRFRSGASEADVAEWISELGLTE